MTTERLIPYELGARFDAGQMVADIAAGRGGHHGISLFCATYRRRGIISLLLFADADELRVYLHKSGRAYLHFLRNHPPEAQVLSRALPFFDAVAALDWDGAAEIARMSRATRQADVEYEEDFLHVRFLMDRFFGPPDEARDAAALARWEQVLQGSPDPRLDVCRAFVARDGALFHDAIDRHLEEREAKGWRLAEKDAISPEEHSTEGQVSIEGMAFVLFAERAGLATREDFLLVPSLAREGAVPQIAADAWLNVEE